MPKLKKSEEEQKNLELIALIEYKRTLFGINKVELGKVIGMCAPSMYERLNCPSKFTLGDLRNIARFFHLSEEEMVKFI